jgi:hypothetical protein
MLLDGKLILKCTGLCNVKKVIKREADVNSRITQSISPLRSHRTVRDSLPSHGSSCFKSQMYCYIMDVPIASVGIIGAAPYTFVAAI